MTDRAQGGGLGEKPLAPTTEGPLSGTGGSAGGGTLAGAGVPSGGSADRAPHSAGDAPANSVAAAGELAGRADSEPAAEAAALGPADGSLADAAGAKPATAPTIGDALRAPGRGIGSGTPPDRGDLGGG